MVLKEGPDMECVPIEINCLKKSFWYQEQDAPEYFCGKQVLD
jgi:hypothetical protein